MLLQLPQRIYVWHTPPNREAPHREQITAEIDAANARGRAHSRKPDFGALFSISLEQEVSCFLMNLQPVAGKARGAEVCVGYDSACRLLFKWCDHVCIRSYQVHAEQPDAQQTGLLAHRLV